MTAPLTGLVVLELGRYIAAPYGGRLLADLGADVIKIEDPDGGDPMRRWESATRPYSPQFAAYNKGKRSVTIDLKSQQGKDSLRTLADRADVLLENFRPGVMRRLGLGSDTLIAHNPRLVYCAVTGFGPEGPYADRPSYDTVTSAMGGMYSLLMPVDDPSPIGPAMSDLLSGAFAVQGILAALHRRAATGEGQLVEVSMLGSILGFLTEAVTSTLETGRLMEPDTRQRRAQAYGCVGADGKAFVVHLSVPDKFWLALLDALERPELADDPRFSTRQARYENYHALDSLLKQTARERTRAEWFERFAARDLPHGALNTMADVATDPQVAALRLIEDVPIHGGPPMPMTRAPMTFSTEEPDPGRPAPRLGEHTDAVLSELGIQPQEV